MDFDDIFGDLNLNTVQNKSNYGCIPEAPVVTDIPDLDHLFGPDTSLLELRPSQWLPATQPRSSLGLTQHKEQQHNDRKESDRFQNQIDRDDQEDCFAVPTISQRGDSQEIYLGSQFPMVKKVKTPSKVQVRPTAPYGDTGQTRNINRGAVPSTQLPPTIRKKQRVLPQSVQALSRDKTNVYKTPVPLVSSVLTYHRRKTFKIRSSREYWQILKTHKNRVPATKMRQGMCLRPVLEIPEQFRGIFKFQYFNIVQSKVFDDVMYTDKSLVVCSPTGSGKTAIFEMAIIRLMTNVGPTPNKNFKVIYMAPIKALCSEKYQDWKEKFEPFGLKVMELTGDTDLEDFYLLQEVNIVLTTPEKWDSMTRKWRDNKAVVQSICLFLVDEIHILNDETRGATVEAVISRMKTIQAAKSRLRTQGNADLRDLRFVAASATLTNIEDIAAWLGTGKVPSLYHKFDDNVRPVQLRKVVLGYHSSDKQSPFQFDITLNYKLAGIINTYSEGKPTLVFCSTRKSVTQGADTLAKDMKSSFIKSGQHRQILQNASFHIKDSKLRDLILKGIGYHHAGMDFQDRKTMEEMFTNGELPVLVATSTLAMGVNLPAHLVIIKSTTYYNMGCHEEYSDTQVLQMIGRAGRPQFDTRATAVIMTKIQTKEKYENLINGTQLVESNLHKNLIEHLNAEIVLGTITDISVAVEWLKFTYLYIRVMKNPRHYGMPTALSKNSMEKRLQDLCMENLNQLRGLSLLQMNEDTLDVIPTENGRLIARYCISHKTAELFNSIKDEESISELLSKVSKCKEFEDIKLRANEKKTLNTLNKDKNRVTIRYPMSGKVKSTDMKVNCLVQAQFGCLLVQDFALQQDTSRIFRVGIRIIRCLVEFLSRKHTNHKSLLSAIQLSKAFQARLWENSKFVSKQLDGIGPTLSNALVNAGLTTFEQIEQTNPREIELIVNRHPPFGNQVRDSALSLPKYELAIEQIARYSERTSEIVISLQITNRDQMKEKSGHTCTLLIGDKDNRVVYKQRIMDSLLLKESTWTKKITVQLANRGPELDIHYISQDWVGLDIECAYTPNYVGGFRISNSTVVAEPVSSAQNTSTSLQTPRKRQKKTETKSKETKQKATPANRVEGHRNMLKTKMASLPTTPSLMKKPKLQFSGKENRHPSLNLSRFAYNPMAKFYQTSPQDDETIEIEDNHDEEIYYARPCNLSISAEGLPDSGLTEYNVEYDDHQVDDERVQDVTPKSMKKKNDWMHLDMFQKHREICRNDEIQQYDEDTESLPDLDFGDLTDYDRKPCLRKNRRSYSRPCDMVQETDYGYVYLGGEDQPQAIDWDDKVTEDINKTEELYVQKAYLRQQDPPCEGDIIESYESDNEGDNIHQQDNPSKWGDNIHQGDNPSKWSSYFSSQSSTASDYLKNKHLAWNNDGKVILEDSRHVAGVHSGELSRMNGIKTVSNGSDGNNHSTEATEKKDRNGHNFGQVLAWISKSRNEDHAQNRSIETDQDSWSDDEHLMQLCDKTDEVHKVKAKDQGKQTIDMTEKFPHSDDKRPSRKVPDHDNKVNKGSSKFESSVFFPSAKATKEEDDFTYIFDGIF